jgi:4-hydroxy-3-polyprenylbenzoate decarboxylase
MAYRSLSHFVDVLEKSGELVRINTPVSPNLEITEIADRAVKNGGKALLFVQNGTSFPVLINSLASDRRICLALGVEHLEEIEHKIGHLFHELTSARKSFLAKLKLIPSLRELSSWFPSHSKSRGVCQQVVMDPPDLSRLPVLTCWPFDGGPFITLPCVHTRHPETGATNLGMYRMQVFGPTLTGMHWHLHKGSAAHFRRYKELGLKMPVTVTLGGDPAYMYAATAPLPENVDEYLLAGFLRTRRVELVRCLTNDLEVPGDVDFVIEGYVDPAEELITEGPFGDHTGFYSLADLYPRFHVTCITHRTDAIYPATIVGIPPMEDGWIGKATERIFLMPVKMTVAPEVTDMHMPVEGVFHNITLATITKHFPGQAVKTISAMWGAGQMMFNKIMAVFDDGFPLHDYSSAIRTILQNTDVINDIHFMKGPMDVLDHASSRFAYGSKLGIDATTKLSVERGVDKPAYIVKVDELKLREVYPLIRGFGMKLLRDGLPLLIVQINKDNPVSIHALVQEWVTKEYISGIKVLVFVDAGVDADDQGQVVWLVANNIDPVRDCFYPEGEHGERFPMLCIDGTSKSNAHDGFNRDWPNIILMDDKTIQKVDSIWDQLHISSFVPSPSLKYKQLVSRSGAVASPIN